MEEEKPKNWSIDQLKNLWDEDSKIDSQNLDTEALRTPRLHSKWYNILIDLRVEFKKAELAFAKEKIQAKNYYNGDYAPDDKRFKTLGHQNRKLKNEDMNDFISADSDLQKIQLKIFLTKEKIEFILNVLKQINDRGFQISNAIKWRKFMSGLND